MAESASEFNKKLIFRIFFFGAFFYLLIQLLRLFLPFFTPLMLSVTLALMFYPIHIKIRGFVRNPSLSSAISTLIIALIVVLPVIYLVWYLVKEGADLFPTAKAWLTTAQDNLSDHALSDSLPLPLQPVWMRVQNFLSSWQVDLQDVLLNNLNRIGARITAFGAGAVKNIAFTIFDLVIMVFTLFFFLRDGSRIVQWIMDVIPMEPKNKQLVLDGLNRTLAAVVRGLFLTAVIQAFLAGLGYWVAGVPFPVLLTFATGFTALIPFAGAAACWLPVCLYIIFKVSVMKGIFLLLWCALVVSLIDNFIRPILISDKAKLPFLLLFLSILGGLQTYGFIGILTGPLLIATALAFVKIYRTQYQKGSSGETAGYPVP